MMKKILVTGGTGFVGTHLCKKLSENYKTFSTSRFPVADLCEPHEAKNWINTVNPDIIIHLAARVGGIGANAKNPGTFMRDNLTMGINVINAALDYGIKKFIMVGTVCSYPKYAPIPFRESSLWDGYPESTNAPYGIAKKTLMELIISYNKQFGFNGINLVPTNMFGPGDNFDPEYSHVIPAIILKVYKALINNDPSITMWGTGTATREFLYVDDFVQAVILALEKKPGPQPINIGTGQEITISALVDKICHKMNYHGKIIYDNTKPDGQPRRCLNIDRAKAVLGYKPSINLDLGLNYTIEWFLQNVEKMSDYLHTGVNT